MSLTDDLTFCGIRRLWIRPARDCKRCAWFECLHHPRHMLWPAVKRVLENDITMRRFRTDCKGKKKTWDGKQKHCARFNALQGGKRGEHPCVNCVLDRPCKHRGGP